VPERPAHQLHIDAARAVRLLRPPKLHIRLIALAQMPEADYQLGAHAALAALQDARGAAPRQELRVALDVGHQVEQLARRIRQDLPLRMRGHVSRAPTGSQSGRASTETPAAHTYIPS